ncbi:MAG: class I SAM-dependent methyltransferase [Bacteroidales bacterium]|jgi:demethylmenaquinone methyltransferase/2-methoxy-6-polyprenyl-1,4-benzoquinol methylase|nr:class I SAM-dependent methyltransferase [Bacteroidales bacterium]MCI2121935.1 class I SAM-dependent methyltransferase [Bacteroidales bacterium]MCI2145466.1 class I SAM-dependent methyltransferase [Bacteroidales bacterium]
MEKIDKSEKAVAKMFDGLSHGYDRFNHIASFRQDRRWIRRLVSEVVKSDASEVLDVACGTGEISIALYEKGINVTGVDISEKMLAEARLKIDKARCKVAGTRCRIKEKCRAAAGTSGINSVFKPRLMVSNAEDLPFTDASFDAVTVAYGVRNFEHLEKCLREMRRVIRPGGKIFVMEFAMPRNPVWRCMYRFYKNHVMRLIGRKVTGRSGAFDYLSETVEVFPQYGDFCGILSESGFSKPRFIPLAGGIAVIYVGNVSI